ncbi:MAG: hypothetical protein ACRDRU_19835 [Pseudonocardiaceae bacterium]
MPPQLRRAFLGPVLMTSALGVASTLLPVMRDGWLLTWLLLGLTAGYALSGSA